MYQDDKVEVSNLEDAIEQTSLSKAVMNQLEHELKKNVDVCDLLQMAKITREFLLKTGGEKTASLYDQMKKFRLDPPKGLKTLKQIQLCHVDSLIEALKLSRAKRMILHKQDPFNLVRQRYRAKLPKDVKEKVVKNLITKMKTDLFLAQLFELIDSMLNRVEDCNEGNDPFPVDNNFADYFYYYGDVSDLFDEDKFNEAIGEDVKNKHIIDLFTQTVLQHHS